MQNCITCGSPWPEQATEVGAALTAHKDWYGWARAGNGYCVNLGTKQVEVLACQMLEDERSHGGDIQAFIIFIVDGVLYRKLGVTNSYGNTEWDGPFSKVVPKQQTLKTWEVDK